MRHMKTAICAGAFIIRLTLSFIAARLVSVPMIAAAAQERGYEGAYGGEWFIIIGAFFFAYHFLTHYLPGKAPQNSKEV